MKRIISLLLALALCVSLTACGQSGRTSTASPAQAPQASTDSTASASNAAPIEKTDDSKILIVYFAVAENSDVDAVSSASVLTDGGEAKGMSKYIADIIAERTGGEMFSIQTEEKFPGQYDPLADRAKEMQNNGELPVLTSRIENLDNYDVIFVGYPIWWYTLPQVMFSFFDEYDFSGQTIIPFNTHYGSRDGGTYKTIAELEPEATVMQGLAVHQNDVAKSREDVLKWLDGLGY